MGTVTRQLIGKRVLKYLESHPSPVELGTIAEDLRSDDDLGQVRDSDVRRVVQSMIVTGKLDYSPDLKIELRKTTTSPV